MPPLLPVLLLLALAVPAARAAWSAPDWSLGAEERLLSDDNLLKLSPADLARLEDDPAFQTDADGHGGLRLEHRLSGDLRWRLKRKTGPFAALQRAVGGKAGQGRLSLAWDGKWAQVAGMAGQGNTSQRLALGWQPRAGWGAECSWRFLDNYDLRQFQDRDTGRERGATFDSDLYQLQLKARAADLGPWCRQPGLALTLARSTEFYNAWFTEYDATARSLGLGLSWRMQAGLSAGLGWQFTETDNTGFTGSLPGGTVSLGADSESGDASQQEDQYSLDLGWGGKLAGRGAGLDGSLSLRDRRYQSDLGELLDPFHYGRHDRRWQGSLRGRLDLIPAWSLLPFYEREWRQSEAAWSGIARTKNYALNRVGLGLRWKFGSD